MSSAQPAPADLARKARDLVEELNRAVVDGSHTLTAPRVHETARALMELVDRLPQAFQQLADVLELRADQGAIRMDTGEDPDGVARATAEDLRVAGSEAHQLPDRLAKPARALFSMAHNS